MVGLGIEVLFLIICQKDDPRLSNHLILCCIQIRTIPYAFDKKYKIKLDRMTLKFESSAERVKFSTSQRRSSMKISQSTSRFHSCLSNHECLTTTNHQVMSCWAYTLAGVRSCTWVPNGSRGILSRLQERSEVR